MTVEPLDGAALADAVRRAGLDPAGLVEQRVLETDEAGWLLSTTAERWFHDWQALRGVVDVTGRWPLAMTFWGEAPDPFSRAEFDLAGLGLDVSPRAIVSRVGATPPGPARPLPRVTRGWRRSDAQWQRELDETRETCGSAPTLGDLHAALGAEPDDLGVERWLLAWELAHPVDAGEGDTSYLDWFDPDDVVLVLLPTDVPWASFAYTGGYECGSPTPDTRAEVARRWHREHGAEPAANWGTMWQLVVTRPPTTPLEAWPVAAETARLWPDTAGGANGVSTRKHARDLVGRTDWFVHYRP